MEEIERGLAAARRVFEAAGVRPADAATAHGQVGGLEGFGMYALADAIIRLRERGADPGIVAAAEAELAWLERLLGVHELSPAAYNLADLWDDAAAPAQEACCQGWSRVPSDGFLDLARAGDEVESATHPEPSLEDQLASLREQAVRQAMSRGFTALADDDEIEGLTLGDLDWYEAPATRTNSSASVAPARDGPA